MLFDLRGAGRRKTIQIVYILLAVLMGGGLILFGIGGSVSGGLIDAITNNNGSSGSGLGTYRKRVTQAQHTAAAHPQSAAAWAALARARFQLASASEYYNSSTGVWNPTGKRILAQASAAWQHHLKVAKKPDDGLAGLMVQAYSRGGLNRPADAATAAQIITAARPTSATFANLAVLAYQAGEARTGDLAAQKALSLASKSLRPELTTQLAQAKAQSPSAGASATVTPAPTASSKSGSKGSSKGTKKHSSGG